MPTHAEAKKLARRFQSKYPASLPDRLEWWKRVLGIDRERFLRLLGLTPKQITEHRSSSWESLVQMTGDRGWWLEGQLAELLSLYSYDWYKLSSDLHDSATRVTDEDDLSTDRAAGLSEWLRDKPSSSPEDEIILNRLVNGGPSTILSLRDYLARSVKEGQRP